MIAAQKARMENKSDSRAGSVIVRRGTIANQNSR